MSDFQNVKDGKPFPPLETLASLTEAPKSAKRPAAKKAAPENSAAKKAAASTTKSGESAATPNEESA